MQIIFINAKVQVRSLRFAESVLAASWIPVLATFAAQRRDGVRGVAWDPGAQLEWEGRRALRPGAQLERS